MCVYPSGIWEFIGISPKPPKAIEIRSKTKLQALMYCGNVFVDFVSGARKLKSALFRTCWSDCCGLSDCKFVGKEIGVRDRGTIIKELLRGGLKREGYGSKNKGKPCTHQPGNHTN